MGKRKSILIGCPQYGVPVNGSYDCDGSGRYLRGPDGQFVLQRVRCHQHGGRCMQTLCVLHRFNRGGAGSWYPSGVYALPERAGPAPRGGHRAAKDGWYA